MKALRYSRTHSATKALFIVSAENYTTRRVGWESMTETSDQMFDWDDEKLEDRSLNLQGKVRRFAHPSGPSLHATISQANNRRTHLPRGLPPMWNHYVALPVAQPLSLLVVHCEIPAILHVFARRAFAPRIPRNTFCLFVDLVAVPSAFGAP